MREHKITVPELAMVAGTRAMAGFGLGLLLSAKLSEANRKAVGWAFFLIGALSTVPLVLEVFGKPRAVPNEEPGAPVDTMRSMKEHVSA